MSKNIEELNKEIIDLEALKAGFQNLLWNINDPTFLYVEHEIYFEYDNLLRDFKKDNLEKSIKKAHDKIIELTKQKLELLEKENLHSN